MDATLFAALGDDVISWTPLVAAPGDEGRRRHPLDRDHRRAGGRGAVDDDVLSWTPMIAASVFAPTTHALAS